jgi:hypothetical protein
VSRIGAAARSTSLSGFSRTSMCVQAQAFRTELAQHEHPRRAVGRDAGQGRDYPVAGGRCRPARDIADGERDAFQPGGSRRSIGRATRSEYRVPWPPALTGKASCAFRSSTVVINEGVRPVLAVGLDERDDIAGIDADHRDRRVRRPQRDRSAVPDPALLPASGRQGRPRCLRGYSPSKR